MMLCMWGCMCGWVWVCIVLGWAQVEERVWYAVHSPYLFIDYCILLHMLLFCCRFVFMYWCPFYCLLNHCQKSSLSGIIQIHWIELNGGNVFYKVYLYGIELWVFFFFLKSVSVTARWVFYLMQPGRGFNEEQQQVSARRTHTNSHLDCSATCYKASCLHSIVLSLPWFWFKDNKSVSVF